MTETRKLRTTLGDAGTPLGLWLAGRLAVSAETAAELIARGSVYLDGRRVSDPGVPLRPGQKITAHVGELEAAPKHSVVYLDEDVLVVDKPAGLATVASRETSIALDQQVAERHAGARVLHRLDRDASGLVLFTLRDETRGTLQRALVAGVIVRRYEAIVAGHPGWMERTLDAAIGRDPADPRRRRAGISGGEAAETRARVLRVGEDAVGPVGHLALELVTGRTHQIRVHLAHAGNPILGDPLYAPPRDQSRAPRLALHATVLEWPGGRAESPLPAALSALLK